MMLLRQGKVDFVDYDKKKYIRIEYTDSFADDYIWYVRRVGEDAIRPVRDINVYAPLEELYQKEVVEQKEEYPYKKYTPEETEKSLTESFKESVKEGVIPKVEDLKYPILNKEELDEFINEIKKNPPEFLKFELGPTLEEICYSWWDDVFADDSSIDDLINTIGSWLPEEQNGGNSQNSYVDCAVEGWNDSIKKIKSKLRNKK
jgi:hypothetical protein